MISVKFFIGFLLGLVVGASIGLALAPEPGARTRAKVMEHMKERTQGGSVEQAVEEMKEHYE